jgi:hypothetical protein
VIVKDATTDRALGTTYQWVSDSQTRPPLAAYAGSGITTRTPPILTYSATKPRALVIDMPHLYEEYNPPASVYAGVLPGDSIFTPVDIYQRAIGAPTFAHAGPVTSALRRGVLLTPPLPTRTPMTTDWGSVMVIRFEQDPTDALFSVSSAVALAEGRTHNALIVGREWIQYVDYNLDVDARTVTFSGLFRGRRGTEPYTDEHTADEVCYIYEATSFVVIPAAVGQTQVEVTCGGRSSIYDLSLRSETHWRVENVMRYDHWQYSGLPATADPGGPNVVSFFKCSSRLRYANDFTDSDTSPYYELPVLPPATIVLLSAPYDAALYATELATKAVNGALPPGVTSAPDSTYILYALSETNSPSRASITSTEALRRNHILVSANADARRTLWGIAFYGSLYDNISRHVRKFVFPGAVDYRQLPYEVTAYGLPASEDGAGGGYKGAVFCE